MLIIRVPIVVVLAVTALAAVPTPALAATGGGCPPEPSGWMKMTFQQAFDKELADTVEADYSVEDLLELFGVATLDELYTQISLPFFRSIDKTDDGFLCLRDMPSAATAPWNSNYLDNRVAA